MWLLQVINATGSVQILKNNLTGRFGLTGFRMSLKWSNIGDFDVHQVQVSQFNLHLIPEVNSKKFV